MVSVAGWPVDSTSQLCIRPQTLPLLKAKRPVRIEPAPDHSCPRRLPMQGSFLKAAFTHRDPAFNNIE